MFSDKVAIIWRLLGDSGDYLAIEGVIAVLLGHIWVTNGSYISPIMRLNAIFAPAHERAPPAPAVHLRSSRAGG